MRSDLTRAGLAGRTAALRAAVPVIGVTGPRGRGWPMWLFAAAAILLQGALPRRLTAPAGGAPAPADAFDGLDGLVIGGGDDVSADLYHAEAMPEARYDPERDRLELEALERLWDGPVPILGICRGSQMMNVFRGGTLHQDAWGYHDAGRALRTPLPVRRVHARNGSGLSQILRRERLRVNSLHKQSIRRPGDGLRVCAEDQHGMTQAVERPGEPLRIGVQWHPEFLFWRPSQFRLWRRLAQEARALSRARAGLLPARPEVSDPPVATNLTEIAASDA
ncbi:MAG: gamma-glutamyl-gamma-aminobutyrate hydrolase family protein [Pseudomonadota bacterium]